VHVKWSRVAIGKHLFGHALAAEVPSFMVALGAALDAAGASGATLSLLPRNRSREVARALPRVALSVFLLGAGVFAGDRIAHSGVEAAGRARDVAVGVARRLEEIRGRAGQGRRELERIERARLLDGFAEERDAWGRVASRLHEAVPPGAVVLGTQSRLEDGGAVECSLRVALPPRAGGGDRALAIVESLGRAGFADVRVAARRAVDGLDAAGLSAPSSRPPEDAWELVEIDARSPAAPEAGSPR
jgi:hypothetical protein